MESTPRQNNGFAPSISHVLLLSLFWMWQLVVACYMAYISAIYIGLSFGVVNLYASCLHNPSVLFPRPLFQSQSQIQPCLQFQSMDNLVLPHNRPHHHHRRRNMDHLRIASEAQHLAVLTGHEIGVYCYCLGLRIWLLGASYVAVAVGVA